MGSKQATKEKRKQVAKAAPAPAPAPTPIYAFRPGSRVSGVDPAAVAAELERIEREDGKIETRRVVDAARAEDNPMHNAFTWDNEKAGDVLRLQEARQLIRAIVIVYPEQPEPQQKFFHVQYKEEEGESAGAYHPVEVVVRDVDLYASALTELTGKLVSAQQSVKDLEAAYLRSGKVSAERAKQMEAIGSHIKAAVAVAKGEG
jgi:hypothetical protein